MGKRIVISVINDLSGDQRIHRIASSLSKAGHRVLVIGRELPNSPILTERSYDAHRMKLRFSKGKLFYLEYNLRLFFLLLKQPADLLNANDLDTLLANFLASKCKRIPLIYDSHEYFTEVPELVDRRLTRSVWVLLEKIIFPFLKHIYTVNESIAEIYEEAYHKPVKVIRNLPHRVAPPPLAPLEAPYILLYQGALNLGRGIPLMIKTMEHLPPEYLLWIIGKGDVEFSLKTLARESSAKERIIFHGFVPFEKLKAYTRQATIGFSLEEDMGANYHYASPNKLYDYIQAQVPVIVSDLPEMRKLVAKFKVGNILLEEQRKPEALAELIREMVETEELYDFWLKNCIEAARTLVWENEEKKLVKIYREALEI